MELSPGDWQEGDYRVQGKQTMLLGTGELQMLPSGWRGHVWCYGLSQLAYRSQLGATQ